MKLYAILKPIYLEDIADLQHSQDIFHAGKATGNPHVFSSIDDANEYREKNQLDGQVIELILAD